MAEIERLTETKPNKCIYYVGRQSDENLGSGNF